MAFAKKCDICGVLYEGYNMENDSKNTNGFRFLNIGYNRTCFGHKAVDCCPECMESIKTHIDGLKKKELYRKEDIYGKKI